jgi:hypothetical protein
VNIEQIVIKRLDDILPVPVFADVPKNRPSSFVTVERTGGGFSDLIIDRPVLAVQCWAKTRSDAANLALTVRDALLALPDVVLAIELLQVTTLYNFPDLVSGNPRYQIIAELLTTN